MKRYPIMDGELDENRKIRMMMAIISGVFRV